MESITDSGCIDILRFNKNWRINHANVVRGELLYWVDGLNPARKVNIRKCKDKTATGYGETILESYTMAAKWTSIFAPSAVYFSDLTKQFNKLYGNMFKFAQRFIYDDDEVSDWSDFSTVPTPSKESFTGVNKIPTDNNGIKISYETGDQTVVKVELAAKINSMDFVSIAVLDKEKLGIASNSTAEYIFYNDSSYSVVVREKIIRPYSYLMKRPYCQAFLSNAMIYINGYEGFEKVKISTDVEVEYQDMFIDSGIENQMNEPYLINTFFDYTWVGSGHGRRNSWNELEIGPDIKKGNKIYVWGKNGGSDNINISYTALISDDAQSVANHIRGQLMAMLPGRILNMYDNQVNLDGSVRFKFEVKGNWDEGATRFDGFIEPVSYNSLKDTGTSEKNTKLGSVRKFGIVYQDFEGRKSATYTGDDLIVKIKFITELGALKKPVISIQLKHQPPIWAKYYYIVRSRDLTYSSFIQMLVQKAISVQTTNQGEYIDLVVGSLFTYQRMHPNTPLKYEFKKGDRIRFINYIDPETNDKTMYPFYEAEVLDYKVSVNELQSANIYVTEGSDIVTIDGTTSTDNIGRIIIVNATEREIVAVDAGNKYKVNKPFPKTESFPTWDLVDRRGVLRIRKPTGIDIQDFSKVEVYTPSITGDSLGSKVFYAFGKKFPIKDAGLETRAHVANGQDQDGSSPEGYAATPAIVRISEGDIYVRNREMPTSNNFPGAQVVVDHVEDAGFSDFYESDLNDNGKENVEDSGDGEKHFGSRARWSNNFVEDTRINGLNDFDSSDRADYNDLFGDIKRTVTSGNRLDVYKELRAGWIPIYATVMEDKSGQSIMGASRKILNDMQYYSFEGGIGNNPEAYCSDGTVRYAVFANAGVIVRISGDGVTPISQIYELDNKVREHLQAASRYGAKIFLGFDRVNGEMIVAIESFDKYVYYGGFSEDKWKGFDEAKALFDTFELLTPPSHGDITVLNSLEWVYTPDDGYVGSDSLTYRTRKGSGVWSDPQTVCVTVSPVTGRIKAWRGKGLVCVKDEDDLNTGYQGYSTLEEYYVDDNTPTGEEKPNTETDSDYIDPILNEAGCPTTFAYRWEVEEETAYCESNEVIINDFDYLVARYFWLPGAGTDLDTATGFVETGVSGVDANWVGFGNGYTVPGNAGGPPPTVDDTQYLQHAGDNTGTGAECVLIRFADFAAANPSTPNPIKVKMHAIWWGSRGTGNAQFELIAYKGGQMVKNGFEFENEPLEGVPGVEVFRQTFVKDVTVTDHNALQAANVETMATRLGTIEFDKTTFTAILYQD